MMCHAQNAPLENFRSCDRSTQSPSSADGSLQMMCTWMFSRVGACGSLPARNLYCVFVPLLNSKRKVHGIRLGREHM